MSNSLERKIEKLEARTQTFQDEGQKAAVNQLCDSLIAFSRIPQGSPEESEALINIQKASKKFDEVGRRR